MNLGQKNLGQMNLGQMNLGQMNLGHMNLGQMNLGQKDLSKSLKILKKLCILYIYFIASLSRALSLKILKKLCILYIYCIASFSRGNVLVPTHPIGNIPTLCQKEILRHNFGQQEMSRQQKTLSGYFLLGNRKCSDGIFAVGTFPIAQQEISRQSCIER
jgi:hypothetical protein